MGGLLDCLVKPGNDKVIVDEHATKLVPIDFAELDGWSEDDHVAAFRTFLKSCRVAPPVDATQAAARVLGEAVDAPTARAFFENYFVPHTVEADELGLVTGYYEPEVQGAYRRDERFTVPVYGRPGDLITLGAESERARYNNRISGMSAVLAANSSGVAPTGSSSVRPALPFLRARLTSAPAATI